MFSIKNRQTVECCKAVQPLCSLDNIIPVPHCHFFVVDLTFTALVLTFELFKMLFHILYSILIGLPTVHSSLSASFSNKAGLQQELSKVFKVKQRASLSDQHEHSFKQH